MREDLIELLRKRAADHGGDKLLEEAAAALEAVREDATAERRALMWLAGQDSGMSSKAICHHMLGMMSDGSFPHDPADLGRCLRLLELFPEWKPRMGEMARYSRFWAALVDRWAYLGALMENEVGIDWSKGRSAPLTYDAMHAAIDQARGIVPEAGQRVGKWGRDQLVGNGAEGGVNPAV